MRVNKDLHYKIAKMTELEQDWMKFDQINCDYSNGINEAKNTYYQRKLLSGKNDQNKTWKILKDIVNGVANEFELPASIDWQNNLR